MLTARELADKAGCYLQIPGHSSVAITADVYRTVKQGEIKAEHQRFGPLWLGCRHTSMATKAVAIAVSHKPLVVGSNPSAAS